MDSVNAGGVEDILPSWTDQWRSWARQWWRHRAWALTWGWGTAIAVAVVVPWLPERYEAKARVQVDTQSSMKPVLAGLSATTDLEKQARVLARMITTSQNLERLLDRSELGLPRATVSEREDTLAHLMSRVKLIPEEAGLYTVSYRDTQPERARRVVEGVVDLFVEVGNLDKLQEAQNATRFLDEQIRHHEAQLMDAERKLTEFKVKHFGTTGVSKEDYFARMAAQQEALNRLRSELRAAEQTRDVYQNELAQESPHRAADVEVMAQRKALDDLLKRLGDQHPDVLSAREGLSRLETQRDTAGLERTALGSPTNPVYQRIRSALADAQAQAAALRSRLAVEEQRMKSVRALADKTPEVEAELAQLTLEVEFARKNYDQLMARGETAALSLKAEESPRLSGLRVVESARTSGSPVFPGRWEMALMGVALTLGVALAVPWVWQRWKPTFQSAEALSRATGRPVLGQVSLLRSEVESSQLASGVVWVAWGLSLMLFQAVWLAWLQRHL
ncbi:MAG: hypothetical protein RI949_2034 [Pseudomonadota bacterium]